MTSVALSGCAEIAIGVVACNEAECEMPNLSDQIGVQFAISSYNGSV